MDDYSISVAAFQGEIIEKNLETNVNTTLQQLALSEQKGIDILCMPESFLHGYFETKEEALAHSIDLDSREYTQLLTRFEPYHETTLLLGLNERHQDEIFNTVVVIEKGKHIGRYRKAYSYSPYDYFSLGRDFPVFEKNGVKYGIIICFDSNYHEPAHILALKGAQIIFCPMFNRIKRDSKLLQYLDRKSHFIARAFENECWLICSDIIWHDDGDYICPGAATILDKNGEIKCQSEPYTDMLITYDIPQKCLRNTQWSHKHEQRLLGNRELNNIMFDIIKDT